MAPAAFDEMTLPDGDSRPGYEFLKSWLESAAPDNLAHRRLEAELLFRRIGITFAVYGQNEAEERIIPFDIIPRILTKAEWRRLADGLEQRVRALNLFLADIYGPGEILKAGIVPEDLSTGTPASVPK